MNDPWYYFVHYSFVLMKLTSNIFRINCQLCFDHRQKMNYVTSMGCLFAILIFFLVSRWANKYNHRLQLRAWKDLFFDTSGFLNIAITCTLSDKNWVVKTKFFVSQPLITKFVISRFSLLFSPCIAIKKELNFDTTFRCASCCPLVERPKT
jgi:hypothetical protein